MNKSEESGETTTFVDGVEYNEYPPPPSLLKLMKRHYAECLIAAGSLRLSSLQYHRESERKILGDKNDGLGLFKMDGHPYSTDACNEVFAFCMSLREISQNRITQLALDGGYDCVISIMSSEEFFRRIKLQLLNDFNGDLRMQAGIVKYNREEEVDIKTLNSQKFLFNVFQKDHSFLDDREYRLAVVDYSFKFRNKKYVDLSIGSCADIMRIDKLVMP